MIKIKNFVLVVETKLAVRIRLENEYCIWLPKSMIHESDKDYLIVDRNIYQNNLNKAINEKREKEFKFLRSLNDKMRGVQQSVSN
jgi:hypothetical protein